MGEDNKTPEPSFFAVIPATVRYEKIPDGAKLLYGEISALCNKKGYCWAGNEHFAELYQVNERTIRNWIDALRDKGHISVSFIYVPGKKQIQTRLIRLTCAETVKKTQQERKIELSTSTDNEVGKNSSIGGENFFHTPGNNFPQVGKNSSIGGEKNCRDNNTNNNTNTTTTTEKQPELSEETPARDETAVEAVLSPEEIKIALLAINRSVLLKTDFYSRASAFMSLNYLDKGYLVWLYKQVELRNPDSFEGLYFTLFFAENMVEKYKISKEPKKTPPPAPPPVINCPVCGSIHDEQDEQCPECSLPHNPLPEQISLFRSLYFNLPPDKRKEYLRKEDLIYSSAGRDPNKLKEMKKALNAEFGITLGEEAVIEEPSRSYHS